MHESFILSVVTSMSCETVYFRNDPSIFFYRVYNALAIELFV